MAKEEEAAGGAPEWLVTFSDLVSLLVTLFIMMLTFSTQETQDLQRAMNLIKGSFGVIGESIREAPELSRAPVIGENVQDGVTKHDPNEKELEVRVRELEGFVVTAEDADKGLRLVPETVSGFAPGDDRPSTELSEEIRRLGRALKRHPKRRFVVEGHADPRTDAESSVGDPDRLGLARARRVARLLGLEGVQYENLVVVSKGMRRPRGDLWTEEGQARNRRVEIVLLPAVKERR